MMTTPAAAAAVSWRFLLLTDGSVGESGCFTSPDEVVMLSSALMRASAVGGRLAGSFARHCMMIADSGGGTSGTDGVGDLRKCRL
jgi:hypothetical protein